MVFRDDRLEHFAAHGAELSPGGSVGMVENAGAHIWHASYGSGRPVVLLHGGMGHAGNFAHQVPALLAGGWRPVLIDTRGHGHSTRDLRPFGYRLLGSDVLAVMDALSIGRAPIIGWSDGACTGLVLAHDHPGRVAGVFFFACNVDPSGTRPFEMTPVIGNCVARHAADFARLSPTPDRFEDLGPALHPMQANEPDYSAADLAEINVPVTVAHASGDEFIRPEHAAYIAAAIPRARLLRLEGVSHFAPLQRPDLFNVAMLAYLSGLRSA